jgi:putative endonuclease
MDEHKQRIDSYSFASRYNLTKLVWYEHSHEAAAAIQREKQLKNWHRAWKIALIEAKNEQWRDLSEEW